MNRLPYELYCQVFEALESDLEQDGIWPKQAIWCSPLPSNSNFDIAEDRASRESSSTLRKILPLLGVDRTLREIMLSKLTTINIKLVGAIDARLASHLIQVLRESTGSGTTTGYKSLEIWLKPEVESFIIPLLHDNAQTLRFLTLNCSSHSSQSVDNHLLQIKCSLPELRSFTYHTDCPAKWLNQNSLMQLMRASPQLQDLKVFRLEGKFQGLPSQEQDHQGIPSLHSLHIRQMSKCQTSDLSQIVANSHQTLKELTIVFDIDEEATNTLFDWDRHGIDPNQVYNAFSECKKLRILRIGDLIGFEESFNGISLMIKNLVKNLSGLEVLEFSGKVIDLEILESIKQAGSSLKELCFYDYAEFPLDRFNHEFLNNPVLREVKRVGISVDESEMGGIGFHKFVEITRERSPETFQTSIA